MITKYRNWGVVLSLLALSTTVLFVIALRKSTEFRENPWSDWLIFIYLGAAILWMASSYTLAKAKGYPDDALGRVFLFSFLLGFCCGPVALIFPLLGFFLKDQTRRHSHRRRRHDRRS